MGLASIILYPDLQDKESGYVVVMVNYLPAALRGLMLAGFAAAFMSTIGTNLNWGASYLVNDFYRRFIRKDASEQHYVTMSQVATVFLTVVSVIVTYFMDSIAGSLEAADSDRRRHRHGTHPALVLVANQRVERGIGDGGRVRRIAHAATGVWPL